MVNTQNNVEYFNRAMTDYLGVNLNENDSRSWQSFIHPDDLQLFLMQWHDALELYQNVEIQCRIKQPNDDYRMCLLSMKFHNEADAILQWAVSLTDVLTILRFNNSFPMSCPHKKICSMPVSIASKL